MMGNVKSNKISIYLIKDKIAIEDIVKNGDKIKNKTISVNKIDEVKKKDSKGEIIEIKGRAKGEGEFYYKESETREPKWIKKFFLEDFNNKGRGDEKYKIQSSSASAVFIVPFIINDKKTGKDKEVNFAICFGYGWKMLNDNVYVKGFGLKIALNTVDDGRIKEINKIDISELVTATEQSATYGDFYQFGIDEENDILKKVTGRAENKYSEFSSLMTGKDAFSVSIKSDIKNINALLSDCYEYYQLKDYLDKFPWIGNIKEISDLSVINKLEEQLIENINKGDIVNVSLIPPNFSNWGDVVSFKCGDEELGDDIPSSIVFGLESVVEAAKLGVKELEKIRIICYLENEIESISWNIWECLCSELTDENNADIKIFLIEGKWFEVKTSVVERVERQLNQILKESDDYFLNKSILPQCDSNLAKNRGGGNGNIEGGYNQIVAEKNNEFLLFDKRLIAPAGGDKKIEFCDLLIDKNIIHVKLRNENNVSQKFSHLFSQAIGSAVLFLDDSKFREGINDEIIEIKKNYPNSTCKFVAPRESPNPSEYNIIFAIIRDQAKPIKMPILSKINFIKVFRYLKNRGLNVYLVKIDLI